jgi:predicted DNA-binding transcriptional regulator
MGRDQVVGALLMVLSVAVIIVYGWIVFFTEWSLLLLQITGFIAVLGVFGILAWIGYTLAILIVFLVLLLVVSLSRLASP